MRFDDVISEKMALVTEQPQSAPASVAPGGGALPVPGGAPGEMPPEMVGMGMGGEGGFDAEQKKDLDPMAFAKSVLQNIVELDPEIFDNYIDTYSDRFEAIEDKTDFKKYYEDFYHYMKQLLSHVDTLKAVYKKLHQGAEQVSSRDDYPDTAGGGAGRVGPSGPGVR